MKRLYFVRHGESQANIDRVYAGRAETPLTAKGREQAAVAARTAKDLHIDHIISSPSSRAYDTAVIIAMAIGIDPKSIELNDLLVERNYGELVGKSWDFASDISKISGVESLDSIFNREIKAYEYLKTLPYDNVLIASHGTFYQALKSAIDSQAKLIEGNDIPNAEIIQLI